MPQIIINATAEQAQRAAVAFGRLWGLTDAEDAPRAATAEEIRQYLIRQLRAIVLQQERRAAEAAVAAPAAFDPT